ncbi:hypothetical protein NPIL_692991 [Nephila pilipes]|uniref:Uncharacterized protein n=1 Tax=Nephila pilipes TaxID=299642 RepID=A0A8X6UU12_NEPPI|nr:hypothetical protein NPIL_692991 [Nephila pilipes]
MSPDVLKEGQGLRSRNAMQREATQTIQINCSNYRPRDVMQASYFRCMEGRTLSLFSGMSRISILDTAMLEIRHSSLPMKMLFTNHLLCPQKYSMNDRVSDRGGPCSGKPHTFHCCSQVVSKCLQTSLLDLTGISSSVGIGAILSM